MIAAYLHVLGWAALLVGGLLLVEGGLLLAERLFPRLKTWREVITGPDDEEVTNE